MDFAVGRGPGIWDDDYYNSLDDFVFPSDKGICALDDAPPKHTSFTVDHPVNYLDDLIGDLDAPLCIDIDQDELYRQTDEPITDAFLDELMQISTTLESDAMAAREAADSISAMQHYLTTLQPHTTVAQPVYTEKQVTPSAPVRAAHPGRPRCTRCYRDRKLASACMPGVPGEACVRCARDGVECTSSVPDGRIQRATRRCRKCVSNKRRIATCKPSACGESCEWCSARNIICEP